MKLRTRTNQPVEGDELENLKIEGDLTVGGTVNADSGTIVNVLGLDSEGKLVKGAVNGGVKLYKHTVSVTFSYTYDGTPHTETSGYTIISTSDTQFTNSNLYDIGEMTRKVGFPHLIGNKLNVLLTRLSLTSGGGIGTNYDPFYVSTFANQGIILINVSYPGGTPTLTAWKKDTIDLTTGEIASRTNLISSTSVSIISDTVTEL